MSYTLTAVLGGVVIASFGSMLGHYIGSKNKVTEKSCFERRDMSDKLINAKIVRIDENMDHMVKVVEKMDEKIDLITRN